MESVAAARTSETKVRLVHAFYRSSRVNRITVYGVSKKLMFIVHDWFTFTPDFSCCTDEISSRI